VKWWGDTAGSVMGMVVLQPMLMLAVYAFCLQRGFQSRWKV
jgi:hypothetical protein